jgi:hypothetical protein
MKITPELKLRFREYVEDVPQARQTLGFLLDNLGEKLELDYSRESFELLEQIFWRVRGKGIPPELSDEEQMVWLMVQYLAAAIIEKTGAKWVQSTDPNPMFGQPSLDGFGNAKWDRIYPVALASNFVSLAKTNPSFPGVTDKTVLARLLDKAVRLHRASRS